MLQNISSIDTSIFYLINHGLQNRLFDNIMPFITNFANFRIFALILAILLLIFGGKRGRVSVIMAVIAISLSDLFSSQIIKYTFLRIRPCNVLENVHLLVGCSSSFSFPSSHAANITSFAIILSYSYRKLILPLFLIAILVWLSRVYVGVHYPFDVLGGIFVGCFFSLLVILGENQLIKYKKENRGYYGLFLTILFLITIFRMYYILKGGIDLSGDEAHYWIWSKNIDLSYYSKGPMVAYIIYVLTHVFGDSVFSLRLGAIVISVLLSFITFYFTREIFQDEKIAFFAFLIPQVIPLYAAGSMLMTTDPPFILFWALTIYFVYLVFKKGQPAYWYAAGIFLGLSLLSKYTALFLPLSFFLYLAISEKYRFYLKRKEPYLALLISFLIFSPVIFWNMKQGLVSFKHIFFMTKSVNGTLFNIKYFPQFVGSQLGVISPFIFLGMIYAVVKGLVKGIKEKNEDYLFLSLCFLPTFLFCLILSLHSKIQANWAASAYFTGIILATAVWGEIYKRGRALIRISIYFSIAISVLITTIMHYPIIVDKMGINLSPKNEPSSRIKGFDELGKAVDQIYKDMNGEKQVFIISPDYQLSSLIAFYAKKPQNVYCVNLGRRMNQYDLWPGFYNFVGRDAIYVRKGDDKIWDLAKAFGRCVKEPLLEVKRNGKIIRSFSIFRCYDFKGMEEKKIERY